MSTAPPVLRFRPILFYPWLLLLLGPVIAVRNYLSTAIQKTGTRNRQEALHTAHQNGWL